MVASAAEAPGRGHRYQFGGPIGTALITFGLPILCHLFTFACNDVSGCPAPSLLDPKHLKLAKLAEEVGWPAEGIWGLCSWKAAGGVLGYYLLNLLLYRILPGEEALGTELKSGARLKYKFNAFHSTMVTLSLLLAGTLAQGSSFPVWTFISDNYVQILTVNIIIAYALAIFVYVRSFSVKPGNKELRELADGGHTGNMMYDFYIGRELNPRVNLPFFGEVDIKEWMEIRPGMLGWIVLNLAFVAKQHRLYGYVSDSIVFVTAVQGLYVLDAMWFEPYILTTIDVISDGFGFMLSFGDLVWVPFIYSQQARYLAVHPVSLGPWGLATVLVFLVCAFLIFRFSNQQKNTFRTDPNDPSVRHLKYIETKAGTRLLVSGWWGIARHINYLGDWLQSWPYSLPTKLAGYAILAPGVLPEAGEHAFTMKDGRSVVQGNAKGWGMIFTYFYVVYFAVLLIHRESRDDEKCARKYGEDWERYKKIVRWKIVPGIY